MLNKVDFPLTTSQISEFVLDKGYTTYFKLQEAISELTQSELIRTETTHNRTLYHLTESGAETIHYFSNKIFIRHTQGYRRFSDRKSNMT